MIIDGRKIASEIKDRLLDLNIKPRLAVILVGNDPASVVFVKIKQKFGASLGAEVVVYEYESNVGQGELEQIIKRLADDDKTTGIIVQLPLPEHLETDKLLNLIPGHKDVDALGAEAKVLSPVVGAVKEILTRGQVMLAGKKAVVVGKGKLVGKPVAVWLAQEGAQVEVADSQTSNLAELLKSADIVVAGAGQPHFIKPTMIKEGVILIDAATSESSGRLAGDADPACAEKCAIFTPVPGGVGPITVAKLFENLFFLSR